MTRYFKTSADLAFTAHDIRESFKEQSDPNIEIISNALNYNILDTVYLEKIYNRIGTVKLNRVLGNDFADFLCRCANNYNRTTIKEEDINAAIHVYLKMIPELEVFFKSDKEENNA